jgi:predicted DNA-binding mobile mystery protein A
MKRTFRKRDRRILDDRFKSMRSNTSLDAPSNGWIRSIRESVGMSAADLGARLGITPQSVLNLEKSELNGRAQMDSLKKTAEAMDCTFVYAIIPNSSLEDFVQRQLRKVAAEKMMKVSHSMKLEDQEVEFNQSLYAEFLKEFEDSALIWRNDRTITTRIQLNQEEQKNNGDS